MPIKRALDLFRKKQVAEPKKSLQFPVFFEAPAPQPAPPPPPDEFYLAVRCAVSGFYSRALYGRDPGGMFVPKTPLVKVEAGADSQGPAVGPVPQIAAGSIRSLPDGPCLWCGGELV